MMMEVYDLITGYRDWLKYFTRREFSPHFYEYKSVCEPVITALEDPAAAAAELLERLEQDWAAAKGGRRIKLARENDKMFICMFFNPMAMDLDSPNGKILAEELCRLSVKNIRKRNTRSEHMNFIWKASNQLSSE